MITSELDPFFVRGGIAYATRRLADQLTALGINTRVLLPGWVDTRGQNLAPLLTPLALPMRADLGIASRAQRYSQFCQAAFGAIKQIGTTSDPVIAHGDEGAMFIALRNGNRSTGPTVFWLHTLYDPPFCGFPKAQLRALPAASLLASAVMMADIVVTSSGILKDARDFEWPEGLRELQSALMSASAENRVLTVESVGCLPELSRDSHDKCDRISNYAGLKNVPSPYVLFPSRPTINKGLGIFAAIADRLQKDNIACVALRPPMHAEKLEGPPRESPVYWLPWLSQEELSTAMRNAACTVLPSLSEGFGLTAAESIRLGVPTLYHPVGGHHCLPAVPNALPISLTTSERASFYRLWSELSVDPSESWSTWKRYENPLKPLINKWVEAIRCAISRADSPGALTQNISLGGMILDDERWANKLRHRIEMNGSSKVSVSAARP